MKWNNVYLLSLDNDYYHKFNIQFFSARYGIPRDNCFNLSEEEVPGTVRLFGDGTQGSPLGRIDFSSKLIVFGHGNQRRIAIDKFRASPRAFAEILAGEGLRQVGQISFHACNIGSGNFLEDFLVGCNLHNIQIGWLKGFKDRVSSAGVGAPWTIVGDGERLARDSMIIDMDAGDFQRVGEGPRYRSPEDERTKILKGNTAISRRV